jgi:Pyridoxal-dependent decarboxylase conserved domain
VTLKHPKAAESSAESLSLPPLFTLESAEMPRNLLPEGELPPDVAYQLIHDELMLDGNARLSVATFVTTWMEPQAEKLMAECFDKNMIDKDEYPQTAEIETRCVSILSRLWHATDAEEATGCSTTGSSEAAMLGGLALKRRWQKRRAAAGKPADTPNLVMGINVVCWEKFANYWDVEMRLVPMEGDRFHLSAEEAVKVCDGTRSASSPSSARRSTARTSRSKRSATRSMPSRTRRASMFGSTSTVHRGPSSHPSSIQIWRGTSGSRAWPRSTRPGTSTASSTRVSAGSYGGMQSRCPRT